MIKRKEKEKKSFRKKFRNVLKKAMHEGEE